MKMAESYELEAARLERELKWINRLSIALMVVIVAVYWWFA